MATKINVRSPFYIKATPTIGTLTSAEMQLYIYTGVYVTDKPASAQYTITKTPISGNNYVTFEVAELIRDYLDISFNQEFTEDEYITRVLDDGGVFEGSPCLSAILDTFDDDFRSQTVWVESDITVTYEYTGTFTETFNTNYLAFDGYGYYTEEANPELSRTLLQSNTDMYVESGKRVQVPVYTDVVDFVEFYNNSVLQSRVTITPSLNSNAQIKYAGTTATIDEIRVLSGSDTETINVYQIGECKFTPYKVTFVNKFGALQNVYFFKKSVESINTTSERYKASIFNQESLAYDVQNHQYREFLKQGKESITMNTGFISEQYNEVIKQLLLSEQIWVTQDVDGISTILPMNLKTQTLQYKTSVNDKLINYTLDFDYSFDEINTVR